MKYNCDIIRDLLPLYIDDVASVSSRQMVEEHLQECPDCRKMLSRLKNDETENAITAEKEEVIADQRRFFRQNSAVAGSVIAGIFMIPILVCLIVNLASGAGLTWFFIVLSALLVAGSVSIVPLMAPENKGLWTLGSFTASILLLLGVCCLYSGGRWFFLAGTAVLFGLSLIFLPFAVKSKAFSGFPENRKGITVMAADTALYVLMMLTIGLHVKSLRFFVVASSVSIPLILLAWAIFFFVCHKRKNRPLKDDAVSAEEGAGVRRTDRKVLRTGEPARAKEKAARRLRTREIVFLAVGFPIWLPLLVTAFFVLLAVFIVIWALVIALWAVEVSFIAGAVGGVGMGIFSICRGEALQGITMICAAVVLAGLAIILFFGCRAAGKGAATLVKKTVLWIKSLIQGKEKMK